MSLKSGLEFELYQLKFLSPAGYHLALHIRFATPLLVRQSYDRAWIERYTERGFALLDPTTIWGFSNTGWIRWSDPGLRDPEGVFSQASDFGLAYGLTCSCGQLRSRSLASFARSEREFSDEEVEKLHGVTLRLHDLTAPANDLTDAQIDALRCIANGDRHTAAAQQLGISESALKARISGARIKLGARTTAEAIQRAKDFRLL